MGNWQWLLDLPVTALLAATLLRTYRLDRALTALRRDRGVFEALMAEFDANARQARENIEKLRDTTDGAARGIERQSAAALVLKDDLALLVERGERAAERLDHGLRLARARPMPSEPVGRGEIAWSEPARSDPAPIASALAAARAAARMGGDGQGGDAARVRSKAERDLLMALQAGR